MVQRSINNKIQAELEDALQSQLSGNRGRARVCARRAAGAAARHYLEQQQGKPVQYNVYRSLLALKDSDLNLDPSARTALERLTRRVNKDHQLPPDIDLITEARTLIACLLDDPAIPGELES